MSARVNPTRLAAMTAALRAGDSFNKIAADNDMVAGTVRRWLQPVIEILDQHGDKPRWLEGAARKRAPMTGEQKAEIEQRLSTAYSLRQIAQDMGLNKCTVAIYAKPLVEAMRAAGTIGKCVCGKDRFHPRICPARVTPPVSEDQLRRRIEITAAIMAGDTFEKIAERFGLRSKGGVRAYLRYLTPEQQERRKAMQHSRKAVAVAFRPFNDGIYARIAAAMPRWLSEAARDDTISDMYLAILDGQIAEKDIEAEAKRYANRTVASFESRFGPRSLDERLGEDGGFTLADRIEDIGALEAFDMIDEARSREHYYEH